MAKAAVGTDEQQIATFEKAKGLWDGAYGKGQHVLTARCLVGIGVGHDNARAEHAPSPGRLDAA